MGVLLRVRPGRLVLQVNAIAPWLVLLLLAANLVRCLCIAMQPKWWPERVGNLLGAGIGLYVIAWFWRAPVWG